MNKAIKKTWLKALRSGEYGQAIRRLRRPKGFCCLGVLCDIQKARWHKVQLGYLRPMAKILGDRLMPRKFCAGLSADEEFVLASMNDRGCSFSEIADYIEAYL